MLIDGYEITELPEQNRVHVVEVGPTKSWDAMLNFCARFPPSAPEWDAFVLKHHRMQEREAAVAVRKYSRLRLRLEAVCS